MSKIKKFIIKYKVTNKNLLIRYKKEQEKDPKFNQSELAKKFGILNMRGNPDRTLVCRWISLNTKTQRLPSKSRACPSCKKSLFQYVEEWINDGSLN